MKIIYKAIANYWNAKADKVRAEIQKPHEHSWELMEKIEMSTRLNPENRWYEYLYRCTSCCEAKNVSRHDL